jgi:signal transduction histidine kinase
MYLTSNLKRIDSKTAEIRIRDEGQGFSEEDLKKAFGRFQKLSSVPTGKERSTGLGLALCKQLVELHRGSIRLESAGKNQDATLVVELLLADDSDLRTS